VLEAVRVSRHLRLHTHGDDHERLRHANRTRASKTLPTWIEGKREIRRKTGSQRHYCPQRRGSGCADGIKGVVEHGRTGRELAGAKASALGRNLPAQKEETNAAREKPSTRTCEDSAGGARRGVLLGRLQAAAKQSAHSRRPQRTTYSGRCAVKDGETLELRAARSGHRVAWAEVISAGRLERGETIDAGESRCSKSPPEGPSTSLPTGIHTRFGSRSRRKLRTRAVRG